MGRKSKPSYWNRERAWFCRINGVLHRLSEAGTEAETKAEAEKKFHRLMVDSGKGPAIKAIKVPVAADKFLEHSHREHAAGTYEQYRIKLTDFARKFRGKAVGDLRPSDVSIWIAGHEDWSDATKRGAITAVKVMCGWLVKERILESNPVASVPRPRMPKRDAYITPEERTAILGMVTEPFKSFLVVLAKTGARPGEIAKIEAKNINWAEGVATLKGKTTRATGKMREIRLAGESLEICRRMAEQNPDGPIFRNAKGRPWTRNAIRLRMAKLPFKAIAYGYRHSWVTDSLVKGVAPALVAELAGHSDLGMISDHYAHLATKRAALKEAAERAASEPDVS